MLEFDGARSRRRASRPAWSTSSPATAPRSAPPGRASRRSPRSPSPAATRPAPRSTQQAARRHQARVAGARRQVAQHRVRRREPRRRGEGRGLRHLRRHRPDLHRRLAPAGAGLDPRRGSREARRAGQDRAARRSDGAETQVGPITTPPQCEKILDYIDIAKGEGAALRAGRRHAAAPGAAAAASSSSRRSSPVSQRDAHRPGGGVRPGAVGHPVQGRGGGGRDRQRHRLRPRRRRVDLGHPPRASPWPTASGPAPSGSTPTAR